MAEAHKKYTKYEKARILGSRALQISMGAPMLIKLNEKDLEEIRYDPLKIAMKELESGVMPITVRRPFPKSKEKIKEEKKSRESKKE